MTTIDTRTEHGAASLTGSGAGSAALAGVTAWITTADHKRVGRLFLGFSLLLPWRGPGGRVRCSASSGSAPDSSSSPSDSVDQLFSLYRVAVPFFVVAPLLLGLGIAVVPLQLGARGMAFGRRPRSASGAGSSAPATVIAAFIGNGGPGGGDAKMVELFLAGLGLRCSDCWSRPRSRSPPRSSPPGLRA